MHNLDIERAERIAEYVKKEGAVFDSKLMRDLNLTSSQLYRAKKFLVEDRPNEFVHKKSTSGILGIFYIVKEFELNLEREITN